MDGSLLVLITDALFLKERRQMHKFKILVTSILICLAISGCGPTPMSEIDDPQDVRTRSKMPEHLKDCTFDRVGFQTKEGWDVIYVMRCPNSTTSTERRVPAGKTSYLQNIVVIDGVEYTPMKGKKLMNLNGEDYISLNKKD